MHNKIAYLYAKYIIGILAYEHYYSTIILKRYTFGLWVCTFIYMIFNKIIDEDNNIRWEFASLN